MQDTYKLHIKFQAQNWKEYDFVVNDFTLNQVLHKDLKPADTSCQFSLLPDVALNNLLLGMGEYDTPAKISKNGQPFFFGYIKKGFTIPKKQRLQPVALELVSGGYLLKQKLGRDVFIKSKKTVSETVKEILELAGVEYNSIPTIDDILYGVHLKAQDSYHSVLTQILFEYGYTFVFDENGKFSFVELFIRNPQKQYDITGRDCLDIINLEYSEKKKTQVSVDWAGVEIVEDSFAFKETEGAQAGYSCYIELLPASYYKNAADGVYIPYQHKDGEVVYAENVTLDIDGDMSYISVQAFEALNTKAFVKIKNTDNSFSKWIRKLNFKADKVYVKKSKNKSKVANNTTNEKIHTVKADYIYTKVRSERLASDLLNYYSFAVINYKINSKRNYPLGAIVTISDTNIGTGLGRILEKKVNILDGRTEYIIESVGKYNPSAVVKRETEIINKPITDGKDGKDGKPGKPGKDGKDGASAAFPSDNSSLSCFPFNDLKRPLINPHIEAKPPTNQVTSLVLTAEAQADKTIRVTIRFKYTQGIFKATHFILYQNTATGVPELINPDVSSAQSIAVKPEAGDDYEYTITRILAQTTSGIQLHYRFALTAAFLGSDSLALHKDGVVDGGDDWHDVTVAQSSNAQNIEKLIQSKLDDCMIKLFSHGYIQFPGEPEPKTLYSFDGYEWEKINYDGCFFRAEGKGALPFDAGEQGDAMREIDGALPGVYGDFENLKSGAFVSFIHKNTSYVVPSAQKTGYAPYFTSAAVVPTANENRPRNRTIIIWRLKKI